VEISHCWSKILSFAHQVPSGNGHPELLPAGLASVVYALCARTRGVFSVFTIFWYYYIRDLLCCSMLRFLSSGPPLLLNLGL